uniref:Iron-sulfur cluster-binding protein n=1 Tax=uncultured microorganism TaxID=358574 RepID=K0J3I2_9ZZZZ|nr:iron-sulfur cluster-binding protein [uncultured microorganism]BAM62493.1 iron-sulfur cluster-binding protein [uncultured microorganism]
MEDLMEKPVLSENIRRLADSLGIDVLGFAEASEFEGYILNRSKRRDPRLSLSDAKTIIVAGIYIGGLVLPSWDKSYMGKTSRLFLSGFFNDAVKPLEPIATLLRKEGYTALICDYSKNKGSIPPLKLAAIRAGLGWQGKNSLLVTKKYGTFLALGGIVTNANLEHNTEEETNRCKSCEKCQQACPLKALKQAYVLNRNKCLSYLLQTDNLPEEAKPVIENRVIDCEICQQVCPWNTKHIECPLATAMTTSFQREIPAWEDFFALPQLAKLTERVYREALGHLNTGIPYLIFHRNVMMAMERLQQR